MNDVVHKFLADHTLLEVVIVERNKISNVVRHEGDEVLKGIYILFWNSFRAGVASVWVLSEIRVAQLHQLVETRRKACVLE